MSRIFGALRAWWSRLWGRRTPQVISLVIHPYAVSVTRNDYLEAWDRVRDIPEVQLIIRTLHNNLVAVLEERCPTDLRTAEERSIWLAGHDARKKVLLDLTAHAMKGRRLAAVPEVTRPPQLVAGGTQGE